MKKSKILFFLFIYHLLFVILAFYFILENNGDAKFYWFYTPYTQNKGWFDFLNYGTDFILFLNYPFVKLGVPFFIGFLIYGTIGYFGILKWIQWTELVVKDTFIYKEYNFLYLLFFLPNLHIWTAMLGKEALVFWAIATIFYAITIKKYKTVGFIIASLVLLIIRPHVALMLLSAVALIFVFQKNYSLKKRVTLTTVFLIGMLTLVFMVFKLTKINYFNWDRIRRFNEFSALSFRNSGSYVPMLEYSYFYKLFSFNFRPLFFDAHSIFAFFASIENLFVLVVCIIALFFAIRFYKKINYTQDMKVAFLFSGIASILYIERYANIGIFMRTKIMFQPFMVVAALIIIKQGMSVMKNIKNG